MEKGDADIYIPLTFAISSVGKALSELMIFLVFIAWAIFCVESIEATYMAIFFAFSDLGVILRRILNVWVGGIKPPLSRILLLLGIAEALMFLAVVIGCRMVYLGSPALREEYLLLGENALDSNRFMLEDMLGSSKRRYESQTLLAV